MTAPDDAALGPFNAPDGAPRSEAEETLRAIAAGECDAFVVSDGRGPRVFTVETAEQPYRMLVENMRDGAATLSSSGLILYANRRLTELLSCSRETVVGSPLAMFLAGGGSTVEKVRGPGGLGATVEVDLVDRDGAAVAVLVGSLPLQMARENLTCLTFTDLRAQKAQEREIARLSQAQAHQMADSQDDRMAVPPRLP